VRGGPRHFSGGVPNPEASVRTNIDEFRQAIEDRDASNRVVARAVESNFAAVLGREASARRRWVTLDEVMRENRSLDVDLRGLKT